MALDWRSLSSYWLATRELSAVTPATVRKPSSSSLRVWFSSASTVFAACQSARSDSKWELTVKLCASHSNADLAASLLLLSHSSLQAKQLVQIDCNNKTSLPAPLQTVHLSKQPLPFGEPALRPVDPGLERWANTLRTLPLYKLSQ